MHDELDTRNCDAVAKSFVSGGVGSTFDICPAIGESLEPFTLQRCQPSDEVCAWHILLRHQILAAATIVAALRSECCTAGAVVAELGLTEHLCLIYKISGILVLSGTLGADNIIALEDVHTLSAEDGVVIGSGQCVGNVFLISNAVATILRLAVDGVACDTEDRLLFNKGNIVATRTIPSGHGRADFMGAGISGVDAVIFIDQRLMSMFLRTECPCDILAAFHDLTTLVVQAQNARHHVCAALGAFQSGCNLLLIADAACFAALTCRETCGNERLLFHPRLRRKCSCHIVEVTHFISLIGCKGDGGIFFSLRNECLHLHVCGRHERA